MARGGTRTGSGRPKGAANRFSEAARAEAAAVGITPLEYFLSVLRDEAMDRATRMDAGKAAAPYMHARLESVKHSGTVGTYDLSKVADADLNKLEAILGPIADAAGNKSGEGEEGGGTAA